MRVHAALQAHERAVNADVAHPLMRELELPYPLLVGRVARRRLVEPGPGPARVRGPPRRARSARAWRDARAALQAVVDAALDDGEPPCELTWRAARSTPARPRPTTRGSRTVRAALSDELGREAPLAGVPWGADMRLFTARGIPTVMVGTAGIELAHAVDESVSIAELITIARTIIRALCTLNQPKGDCPL